MVKNRINGIKIMISEFRLLNNNSPCDVKIQNTASDNNHISKLLNILLNFLFKLLFKIYFIIWASRNGITMTINNEYNNCV